MLKEFTVTSAVAGLVAAAFVAAPVSDAAVQGHAKRVTPTAFALGAGGYASYVKGGDVPAGSDRSAFVNFGCTNKAGLVRKNKIAEVDLGALTLKGAATRAWTTQKGGTVSSWARHSIAKVMLLDTPMGSLYLNGVNSTSRAWHDSRGYHARTSTSLASIVLDPAAGPNQSFPVPNPGQEVNILDLVTLGLGAGKTTHSRSGAVAQADALHLKLHLTDTEVFLAHSRAVIGGGVKSALFSGSAYGAKADVLEGTVTTGRIPAITMPCQGTGGKLRTNGTAHVDLAPGATAAVLKVSQRASASSRSAAITERAALARVTLGNGLAIRAVVAKAQVTRNGSKYRTSAAGTSPGVIRLNGQVLTFPKTGVIQIPGVARIERNVITRSRGSISVIALRVKLLDERLATINLGYAKAMIRPSGN